MALGSPVVKLPGRGTLRGSDRVDLWVIVGLAIVVVIVAAAWGRSSPSDERAVFDSAPASVESPVATEPVATTSGTVVAAGPEVVGVASAQTAEVGIGVSAPSQSEILAGLPDPTGPILPEALERYQVQRGETLLTIAEARGMSVSELLLWNRHLDEESELIRGEWLWIPQWSRSAIADESGSAAGDGKSGRGGG